MNVTLIKLVILTNVCQIKFQINGSSDAAIVRCLKGSSQTISAFVICVGFYLLPLLISLSDLFISSNFISGCINLQIIELVSPIFFAYFEVYFIVF